MLEKPTVPAMEAHLRELATQAGATLHEWEGQPETDARLIKGPDGQADIYIKPLRDCRVYFDALHEFGHLMTGPEGPTRSRGLRPVHLVQELNAWLWALDAARFPPTLATVVEVHGLLGYYAEATGAVQDMHDYYGEKNVPAEHRAAYSEGIERLIRLEKELRAEIL